MLVKTKIRFLFSVLLFAAVLFTTCDSPMGMGKQIDWEPPVLTLDPVPNPYYVRLGSVLTGTATDNEGVERIIFTNTATGEELFPVIRDGINWKIELEFTEAQNGEKIIGQITAYDRAGNSGEPSIAIVTMIVDIRPPIVESMIIQRTNTRVAQLEPLRNLKLLETTDPNGEKKDELYRYQNGWFYINGVVKDEETKIEIISLDFYDVRETNTLLLSLPVDEGYSKYFPRWTIKEEKIIEAGKIKWGEDYETNYYKQPNGERYYYRVVIKAIDMSENENVIIEEDEGFMCLFAKSDDPKGILDPVIGGAGDGKEIKVSKGTPLPVDFYDDDSLLWAYTGLLTYEQWRGQAPIFGTQKIPVTDDDNEKIRWLKKRLRDDGDTVYDWKYDKHATKDDYGVVTSPGEADPILELIKYNPTDPKSLDEKLVYLPTGNGNNDYGDYVLFTLVADMKLDPHDGNGPKYTNQNGWKGRCSYISIVDENVPVIVFDIENGCPEENTFPKLAGGEYFNIIGYTLRENSAGDKKVTAFRMAWIPFGLEGGPDNYIVQVQNALKDKDQNTPYPAGVQHWDLYKLGIFDNDGVNELIDNYDYNKQNFTKRFSVLGDYDDVNTSTKNFYYDGKRENNTKLFVFYAIDNMGHEVFRQLRLLGMRIPPTLTVYDITYRKMEEPMPAGPVGQPSLPSPRKAGNTDLATGGVTTQYYGELNAYNRHEPVYNFLKGKVTGLSAEGLSDLATIPFQIYPRDTILKYWIKASLSESAIAIKDITMTDVTFAATKAVIGNYNEDDMAYTFCESYPDVTQRTFLIEATDALDNVARIQRTIAVTNAAQLESITTNRENGTFGIKTEIILTAKFTNSIYIEDIDGLPQLNIRYGLQGGGYKYQRLTCFEPPDSENPSMNLNFKFIVPEETATEKAYGQLQTLYEDDIFAYVPLVEHPNDWHPIIVPGRTKIMDANRNDAAFVPGYVNESVNVPNWTSVTQNSLQKNKDIRLDGVRPTLISAVVGGKDAWGAGDQYYFKKDETILYTITMSKPVRAEGTPRFSFIITPATGPVVTNTASFVYQRPNGSSSLVFALPINAGTCTVDGYIGEVRLIDTGGSIVDDVGNAVSTPVNISEKLPETFSAYIKQTLPPTPNARLAGNSLADASYYFNTPPTLIIPESTDTFPDFTSYSTTGGNTWTHSAAAGTLTGNTQQSASLLAGTHDIRVKYTDRAGNESVPGSKQIQVRDTFPKLIAVSISQPNGWYKKGSTLDFNLNFEEPVSVTTAANVRIVVRNRSSSVPSPDFGMVTLPVQTTQTNASTIKISWTNIPGGDGSGGVGSAYEMRDGLYIYSIVLSGLSDIYGNTGPSGTAAAYNSAITMTPTNGGNYDCPNLPYTSADASVKVDSYDPSVSNRAPAHNARATGATTSITLTFREPVMKGSGTITIRPRGIYAIPPVLEDKEYYVDTSGNRQSSPGANRTYISSFYDIYNAVSAADRNTLSAGLSGGTGALTLNDRTGQSAGPYIKTTHGLAEGFGYTGNYSGAYTNGPNPADGFFVPDTATKWVLDYQYGITQNTTVVNNIRGVLNRAKWRWQEVEVVSTTLSSSDTVVTIPLSEPLLRGLEWDVFYPEGTFTDKAGNPVPKSGTFNPDGTTLDASITTGGAITYGNSDYYFTTVGVQPPVIRVNRRSYDARAINTNLQPASARTYSNPTDTANWNAGITVTPSNGWGIGNFNTVHYRVESESPNAEIRAKAVKGAAGGTAGSGSAKGAWTGTVAAANANVTSVNAMNWNAAGTDTAGQWILSNIIRRSSATNSSGTTSPYYTVTNKYGTSERRVFAYYLRMFRSYNRDYKKSELDTIMNYANNHATYPDASLTGGQGIFTFDALEANKSYVVARASLGGVSADGYEGVFRTVIALQFSSERNAANIIAVEGSNIKNGMPSIAGFPVRDAEESGDNRFIKLFYAVNTGRTQYYWVSTEIVSEWYFLSWGGGEGQNGTHMDTGEVNNYLTVSYGDLTYAYNIWWSAGGTRPAANAQ